MSVCYLHDLRALRGKSDFLQDHQISLSLREVNAPCSRFVRSLYGLAVLSLFWGNSVFCVAEERAVTLSLDQLINIALERNPDIEFQGYSIDEAEARVIQAESAYSPVVSVGTGYDRKGDTYRKVQGVRVHYDDAYNYTSHNLSVSQYVYDFGKTSATVDQSRFQHESSKTGLKGTRIGLIRDVKKGYYEILRKRDIVKVNEDSLGIQAKHLEQAKALHGVGLRPKIDVTKGEVEYAQSRLDLIKARSAYSTAKVDMENLLGGPPVEGEYRLDEVSPSIERPAPLESLIRTAMENRPEITQLEWDLKAAESKVLSLEREYYPTLSANALYELENAGTPLNTHWEAGLHLTWTLYSGLERHGKVKESRAALSKVKSQMRKLKLQVTQDVSLGFINVQKAIEAIDTAKSALRQAEENMDLAEGRYRTGEGDAIEYSDAELNLTQSRNDVVQTRYDYLQSLADLAYALGGEK